ncbi:ABC transporter family substrate-binding protein [Geodermatophilus sp. DSM 44513]|uniref:ABC transporter family substrate-binding protein n=1 Tax=Geodermatophilus sp. DSM 44513 TaxID=1528104 RepID=UPI00126EE208|nr:ABC transporter family substrate-binding protein [Geodermatophilus sp. DSM 44513]WNV76575.1 ABC transporter family substrate-binding protein [Geodermatophilus sp. DSM 44513]
MRLRSPLRAAAACTAVTLILTGCGGGTTTEGGGGTGEAAPATENEINPVDRAELTEGGDLRWALTEIPPNFNYYQFDGTLADNADVIEALMPTAFHYEADATPVVAEDYFTSIELTSQDPQQVTYDINPDATWSDGTPITAADMVAQWQASNGTNPAYNISSSNGWDQIESVEPGESDKQAVVTFANPYSDWQALYSPLYPASTNTDPEVFNTGWIEQPQVTAGPFRLQGIDRNAQTITLERNPDWWGEPALLDRIIYRVLESDAQIDALLNGELDFIEIAADVNKLQRAQSAEGIAIRRAGGPNFRHITINGTSPVLSDVNVRQALAKAIDRQTIADALIGPLGGDTTKLDNHIFMTNQEGYQGNAGELAEPDVAAANAQLDEAGWTREGEGTRTKDGQPLSIRMVIPSGVAASAQEAQLIQSMLAQVGAELQIETVAANEFFNSYVLIGNYDMTVFAWLGTPFPISSSQSIYAEPQGEEIQQNFARVGSPEIDQLLDQATQELDPARARELANQADAEIWEIVHSLTLYQRPDIIAATDRLANLGAQGFASERYEDIGFTS